MEKFLREISLALQNKRKQIHVPMKKKRVNLLYRISYIYTYPCIPNLRRFVHFLCLYVVLYINTFKKLYIEGEEWQTVSQREKEIVENEVYRLRWGIGERDGKMRKFNRQFLLFYSWFLFFCLFPFDGKNMFLSAFKGKTDWYYFDFFSSSVYLSVFPSWLFLLPQPRTPLHLRFSLWLRQRRLLCWCQYRGNKVADFFLSGNFQIYSSVFFVSLLSWTWFFVRLELLCCWVDFEGWSLICLWKKTRSSE